MIQEAYSSLKLQVKYSQPTLCTIIVHIPVAIVDAIYNEAIFDQKKSAQAVGFAQGQIPTGYIEHNFRANLIEHLQEFLFNYLIVSFLYQEIHRNKIIVAGQPRLANIYLKPHQDAQFHFECSVFAPIALQNWKFFPFKTPKRKNYKDLDRQVETFMQEERDCAKNSNPDRIKIGDWVCFNIALLNDQNKPVLDNHQETVWLKIGDEEPDTEFQELFLDKKIGESFHSNKSCLQDYLSDNFNTQYNLAITIKDMLCSQFFCFELFKKHFRLKTNKETAQKLIEVFSYRNDLSLRRSIVEETFKLLLAKHIIEVPHYLILRQQKVVLDMVQQNPDYHVYRIQSDFKERVAQLAEKQIKEMMILDQIAYQENIEVCDEDIKGYLNLMRSARMKDFIYFDLPETKVNGQEMPLSASFIKQFCLREKTLNYIIYHLTKK